MLSLLVELLVSLAALGSIDVLRNIEAFAASVPPLPILGYAYWRFGVTLLVVAWLKRRGARLSAYGFRDLGPIWLFAIVAISATAVHIVAPTVLQPVLSAYFHKPRELSQFASLVGNPRTLLWVLPAVWLFAAFGEEVFYRGFVLETLRRIFGGGSTAMVLAIVGQASLFGLAHAYQGPVGMIPIGVGAVGSGFLYWAGGKRLWPLMVAHGIADTIGMLAIYAGMMPT